MKKIVKPSWLAEGPLDEEYKTYKLMSKVASLKDQLGKGNLESVLSEVEDTLDYLYMYDAIKASEDELASMNADLGWEELELVYSTPIIDVDRDDVIDNIYIEALSKFEDLHSLVRALWQDLESQLSHSYFYKKPHLINDGFLFVVSEGRTLDIFSFKKPGTFIRSWREFMVEHITTEDYTEESIKPKIEELLDADTDKVLLKLTIDHEYPLNTLAPIVRCYVFNALRKDYGF